MSFISNLLDDYYTLNSTKIYALDVLDNDVLAGNASITSVSQAFLDGQLINVVPTVVGGAVQFDTTGLADGEYTFTYTVTEFQYPEVPSGQNLLVNGSFEQGHYCFDCYGQAITTNLCGWDVSGQAQVNKDNAWWSLYDDHSASDGHNYLELDAGCKVDGVSQTVSGLSAGDSYQFTFDMMGEPCYANAKQVMEVVWNGEVVGTYTADQASWESLTIDLTAIDGDNVLTLRETSSGNDNQGIFLDNLSLEAYVPASSYEIVSDENLVVNGSFEFGCLRFNCYGQAIGTNLYGWDVSGEYQINRGTHTDSDGASDGNNYAELDANCLRDGLSQTIDNLQEGETYRLSIDMQSRDYARDAETMEIYWNGELVDTVNATTTDWATYTIDLVAVDGDNELSLQEPAGENNRFGVLLDNINLNHVETVEPIAVTKEATVTVVVDRANGVNDIVHLNGFNGTPTTATLVDVLANDDDPLGQSLTITNVTSSSEFVDVSIVLDENGQTVLSVLPDPYTFEQIGVGASDTAVISYTAVDAEGNSYTAYTAIILSGNVNPDDAPVDYEVILGTIDEIVDDILTGTASKDIIAGYGGADILSGEAGDDYLFGDAGNDALYGGLGNDELSGGRGNDTLFGGEGDDLVDGDQGNDIIAGGVGNDDLYGDSGADTFVFSSGDGNDIIHDFENGSDMIDLTSFGAGAATQLQLTENSDGTVLAEIGDVTLVIAGNDQANLTGQIGLDDFIFAA